MLFEDLAMTSGVRDVLKRAACAADNARASHVRAEFVLEELIRSDVPIIKAAVREFDLEAHVVSQMSFRPELHRRYKYPRRARRNLDPLKPDAVLEGVMHRAQMEAPEPMRRESGEVSVEHLLIALVAEPTPSIIREYFWGLGLDYVRVRQFFIRYHDRGASELAVAMAG